VTETLAPRDEKMIEIVNRSNIMIAISVGNEKL